MTGRRVPHARSTIVTRCRHAVAIAAERDMADRILMRERRRERRTGARIEQARISAVTCNGKRAAIRTEGEMQDSIVPLELERYAAAARKLQHAYGRTFLHQRQALAIRRECTKI